MQRIAATLMMLALVASADARDAVQRGNDAGAEILERYAQADQARHANLSAYTAMRRYWLRNTRLNQEAEMTVRLDFQGAEGKRFAVLTRQGSDGVHRRVFQKMLEAEMEASRAEAVEQSRISPRNYTARRIGQERMGGRLCHVVELTPRTRNKFLLEGKAWIDVEDLALVRIEGRPAANVSFWVGKPYLIQEFGKVDGHWVTLRHQSLSETRLLGRTEVTIEHGGYELATAPTTRRPLRAALVKTSN